MRRNSVVRKVVRGYRKGERYAMHCEIVPMGDSRSWDSLGRGKKV